MKYNEFVLVAITERTKRFIKSLKSKEPDYFQFPFKFDIKEREREGFFIYNIRVCPLYPRDFFLFPAVVVGLIGVLRMLFVGKLLALWITAPLILYFTPQVFYNRLFWRLVFYIQFKRSGARFY